MKYNFDEIVNRENTASVKYDLRLELFGKKDVIPMWVADMDFKTPDFIINAIKERTKHEVFGYSIRPKSYFTSIINWLNRRHHWDIQEDWISFSPGIVPAINMAILAYSNEGDKIIVQPPVYFPFFSAIENNKRTLVENPLVLKNNRYCIDFKDLEEKLKDAKLFLLSNPHNPGGTVWTKEELKKLGDLCVKNNVLIMSDEIHADLVFSDYKFTPLASISEVNDLPCVCVDPHITPTTAVADLHVPVAFVGVEVGGCAYRMDNVPIETHKVVEPPEGMLTDEEFLGKVYERMKKLKGV